MVNRETTMKHALSLCFVAALALTGCGGGDDASPPPATSQVPASASESVPGFIAYLQALLVSMADTLEPVDVSIVTPKTDDTVEPTAVD
jgi:hypothetical protein